MVENQIPKSNNDATVANTTSSQDIELVPVAEKHLKNVIDMEKIAMAVIPKAIKLTTRTVQRISNEKQIINDLVRLLKIFNQNLKVMPFGSATYGFGDSDTNFNICLVKDGNPKQNDMDEIFEKFVAFFQTAMVRKVFRFFRFVNGDRVQKNRIHASHFATKIVCVIQIDISENIIESSQIIRDCLLKEPICYHLIAYVRCWQSALCEAAEHYGTRYFRFNMHLISVLVIFFCQVSQNFPKLANIPSTQTKCINHLPIVNTDKLKRAIGQFFQFYGNIYEKKHKLISVNIGHWEDRHLTNTFQRAQLTAEQKRLRDGIESNTRNWMNCAMFVEDIKSPGMNIAAEIEEGEAAIFQEMCKMFASSNLYERAIDVYLLKVPRVVIDLTLDEDSEPPAKKVALNHTSISSKISKVTNIAPITSNRLVDVISLNMDEVFRDIPITTVDLVTRTVQRSLAERNIFACMKHKSIVHSSKLELKMFGSATYGFGGSNTDFNVLIKADWLKLLSKSFESSLKRPDGNFALVAAMNGNGSDKKRMKIIHKGFDIVCWIHFDSNLQMAETSQLIRNCIAHSPVCYHLIAFVKSWQEVLNKVAAQKEMQAFQFNTYLISVLVIFFLQLKRNFPKLANVQTSTLLSIDHVSDENIEELKSMVTEFFDFYNSDKMIYQKINVHTGQWERGKKKRLGDGKMSIFIRDLKFPEINIAARISHQHIENFKNMCKLFGSTTDLNTKSVNEYLLMLSQVRSTNAN